MVEAGKFRKKVIHGQLKGTCEKSAGNTMKRGQEDERESENTREDEETRRTEVKKTKE